MKTRLPLRRVDGLPHDSFICWTRGRDFCEDVGKVLFVRIDGTHEPCTCACHKEGRTT